MSPKQKEMDSLVEKIHKTILQQDSKNYLEYNPTQPKQRSTLFILCGDHGMNEVRIILSIKVLLTIFFRSAIMVDPLRAKHRQHLSLSARS